VTAHALRCKACGEHIYTLDPLPSLSDPIRAKDYKPANDGIPQPKPGEAMKCPLCNSSFFGHSGMRFGSIWHSIAASPLHVPA
jgi:hypothetical protein